MTLLKSPSTRRWKMVSTGMMPVHAPNGSNMMVDAAEFDMACPRANFAAAIAPTDGKGHGGKLIFF